MAYDPDRVLRLVYAALGRPDQQALPYTDAHAERIDAGWEVLRAVAANPQNPHHGALAALVTVAHNAFLPHHDGEPGIPAIVPFSGAAAMEGVPASPSEIESYRLAAASAYYTGAGSGVAVAHNAQDAAGLPSAVACRYSIVNGRFKFTGFSAQIPLVQLTRSMADTGVPEAYEPTVVKLTVGRLYRRMGGMAQAQAALAQTLAAEGQGDLALIRGGSARVAPVPSIESAQKGGIV